ncbi:MAG: YARHG domain-containing protein [Crocinitomicaceae bacterium]
MKSIATSLILAILFSACTEKSESSEAPKVDDQEEKIKDLETKLEQQKEQINQDKEKRLRDELERKDQEIEVLKNNNLNQSNSYGTNFFARGKGKFPEGSDRRLSEYDISGLGSRDLKIMRNEIFARHGYIFKTTDMINYFSRESWYRPLYHDVTPMLSSIEKANVNLIKSFE